MIFPQPVKLFKYINKVLPCVLVALKHFYGVVYMAKSFYKLKIILASIFSAAEIIRR